MKKSAAFLLILAVFLGCSRHSGGVDNHCISRNTPSSAPLVTAGQLDTLNRYFAKNNLSTAGLQFVTVVSFNATQGAYTGAFYQVAANFFLNGLLTAPGEAIFTFDSTGTLLDSAGGWHGQLPNNDTTGHQDLATLRQLFLNNYKKCTIAGGPVNSKPSHPTAPYGDTCLIASLEYVDAGVQFDDFPYGQQLVKAWLVSSAANTYPSVTVIDSTGEVIPAFIALP